VKCKQKSQPKPKYFRGNLTKILHVKLYNLPISVKAEIFWPEQAKAPENPGDFHDFPLPARPRRAASAQNFRSPATRGKISRLFH
jgi:hypothetical protein